jgi:hypothetical protein
MHIEHARCNSRSVLKDLVRTKAHMAKMYIISPTYVAIKNMNHIEKTRKSSRLVKTLVVSAVTGFIIL